METTVHIARSDMGRVAMRVELGSGMRPTPGYLATDSFPFPCVRVANAWELDIASGTVDEVLALGVMEHLTYRQFHQTIRNVHRMLRYGGSFLFDVPDIAVWCGYMVDPDPPFPRDHILNTLYGWQRWPGDEHKSGWTRDLLIDALAGWTVMFDLEPFKARASRNRFDRPADAHLYVVATK